MVSVPQSTARRVLLKLFLTGTTTPATGKTLAITLSKNGAAFANPSAGATNATELSDGWYYVDLSTTDLNTLGDLVVRGTASGCDNSERVFVVVLATNGGWTALPNAVAAASGGLLILGANTGTVTISDGLLINRSTGNSSAVVLTGSGNGAGLRAVGGSTGNGIIGVGGATSGAGIQGTAAGSGAGFAGFGLGSGAGMSLSGGATGNGLSILGGATSGHGIYAEAQNATYAGLATATAGAGASTRFFGNFTVDSGFTVTNGITANITGNLSGSIGSISGVTFPTNFGSLGINASGHVSRVTLTDTLTTYTGNTPQTGDSFARIGATGSGLTSLAPAATALSTATWTNARAVNLDNLNATVSSRAVPGDAMSLTVGTASALVSATAAQITTDHGAGSYIRNTEPDNTSIAFIKDVIEGDEQIITGTTPWEKRVFTKGTSTILVQKKLRDVNGNNITSTATVIGSAKDS